MSFPHYIYPATQQAAEQCGNYILQILREKLARERKATLAISGGTTPRPMFEYMAKARFDWSGVHIFWVDERAVPPDSPQSNYRLAAETLIRPANIPDENVHRIEAELPPEEAAAKYRDELARFFGLAAGAKPEFDVIHRGIGPDGHTASLFPGEPLIDDRENLVAAVWVEKMKQWRITMLPGVLLAARETAMLVCGADKGEPVKIIFEGSLDPMKYPAQALAREGRSSVWFFDADAGKLIAA